MAQSARMESKITKKPLAVFPRPNDLRVPQENEEYYEQDVGHLQRGPASRDPGGFEGRRPGHHFCEEGARAGGGQAELLPAEPQEGVRQDRDGGDQRAAGRGG